MENVIYYTTTNSPFGPLTLAESPKGLLLLWFGEPTMDFFKVLDKFAAAYKGYEHHCVDSANLMKTQYLESTVDELKRYFAKETIVFSAPRDFQGTPFQISVWQAIDTVPYGHTIAYKDIGVMIGNEKGAQAIGQAVGRNPLGIIVPCHRILGKNGAMTGFSAPGGIETKRRLLTLEGICFI